VRKRGLCEEVAQKESVQAQTPQDAEKDPLAAEEIALLAT
jgi:hypothetical protein